MKEKDKNLKKLTWKYFWQNKLLEVLILIGVLFIPFGIGTIFSSVLPSKILEEMFKPHIYTGTIGQQWLCGAFILFILVIIGGVIYGIIHVNWSWAKNRTERKMEEKEEGGK